MSTPSSPRTSCPSIAETDPGYVNDVLAAATGGTADRRHRPAADRVSRSRASPTWPAASSSASRCSAPASWPAGRPRCSPSAASSPSRSPVLPDAFYRLLAFPNGIAMIGLGYSLWRDAHRDTDAPPAPARPRARHRQPARMQRATHARRPTGTAPPGPAVELAGPCGAGRPQHHPGRRRVAPPGRGPGGPELMPAEPPLRRLAAARRRARRRRRGVTPSWARSSSPPGSAVADPAGTAGPGGCWSVAGLAGRRCPRSG